MAFYPPALEFEGRAPLEFKGLARVLRDPTLHWPPEILDRSSLTARAGATRIALLAAPRAVNDILLNRGGVFPRARLHDRILGVAYGENLVRGDRADWRKQRREITQPFRPDQILSLAPRVRLACDRILAEWDAAVPGKPVDIVRDARRFALDALWRCLFCDDDEAMTIEPTVEDVALAMDAHHDAPLIDHLHDLRPLAALARGRGSPALEADPATGGDESQDLNTLLLFLHAGHDNVTATLTWALWLLAHHPELQTRIVEEWRPTLAAGDISSLDLSAHPLSGAVIRETLRLYPPIMHLIRDARADVDVEGERIEAGFTAVLSLYAMHRNRQWWADPDAFRPERFLGEGDEARRRTVWLPFGAGPRGCVGASFAQLELSLALGLIVSRFVLEPNPGHDLSCRVDFVLRPEGRDAVRVRPRT